MQDPVNQQRIKDVFGIVAFIVGVIIGAWLINSLVFRSFSVSGPSMETTLYTNDRLIVNRLPMTWAALQHKEFIPNRGHVIVFHNPLFQSMKADEYIVKRVIAFGGERVVLHDGKVTVYNHEHPNGFDPYASIDIPTVYITGEVDTTVGEGDIFVIGDHRNGDYSLDSRNGLGTIPLNDIVGPVSIRIFPFNKISSDF
jgi:signal peptidase I